MTRSGIGCLLVILRKSATTRSRPANHSVPFTKRGPGRYLLESFGRRLTPGGLSFGPQRHCVTSITAHSLANCDSAIPVRGLAPAAEQGTVNMNTNINGISELSADDLNGVTGGSDARGAVVGMVIQYLVDTISIADGLKKMTGTLKTVKPMPK